ncbi:hypothetical protein ACLB2K_021705 [Fragaria x ananassa]
MIGRQKGMYEILVMLAHHLHVELLEDDYCVAVLEGLKNISIVGNHEKVLRYASSALFHQNVRASLGFGLQPMSLNEVARSATTHEEAMLDTGALASLIDFNFARTWEAKLGVRATADIHLNHDWEVDFHNGTMVWFDNLKPIVRPNGEVSKLNGLCLRVVILLFAIVLKAVVLHQFSDGDVDYILGRVSPLNHSPSSLVGDA